MPSFKISKLYKTNNVSIPVQQQQNKQPVEEEIDYQVDEKTGEIVEIKVPKKSSSSSSSSTSTKTTPVVRSGISGHSMKKTTETSYY